MAETSDLQLEIGLFPLLLRVTDIPLFGQKIRKNQGHTSRGVKFLIDADSAVHCCCWQLSEVDNKLQQRHHLANNYKDVVYETII